MRVVWVDGWAKARPVVSYNMWGSSRNLFSKWMKGETLVLLVAREGAVVGTVLGTAQQSDLMIWSNDLFEWRVPLGNLRVFEGAAGLAMNAAVRTVLTDNHRKGYGYLLRNQQKVDGNSERSIDALLMNAATNPGDIGR